jgi:hypothetical protein
MATYKVQHSLAGPFAGGTIVTDEQIKAVGADVEFWKRSGAIREVHGDEANPIPDDDAVLTDAALKATIERRIREKAETSGKFSLTPQEQQQIVGEETSRNAERLKRRSESDRNPTSRQAGATNATNPQGQPQPGPNPTPAPAPAKK